MSHMEHFRDGKLFEGERLVIEGLEGELAYREKSGGRKQWFGYFEVGSQTQIAAGSHYNLKLPDGRHAEINASDIRNSDVPGKATHAVEFYVVGEVRGQSRRSLEHGTRRPLG